MLLVVLTTLMAVTFAGQITPKTFMPITPSYNNISVSSDYKFQFQIETFAPEDSDLLIHFPSADYTNGLGISTCRATLASGQQTSCSVNGFTVTVKIGELANQPRDNTHSVTIHGVTNPASPGGTGHFRLETYIGINLLDYCDMFGTLGFINTFDNFASANVSCLDGCLAGDIGTYQVTFTVAAQQASSSIVQVHFPSQLVLLSYVPCSSQQLPGIFCDVDDNNKVKVLYLGKALVTNTTYRIQFTDVVNPNNEATLDQWTVDLLNGTVNNIIYRTSGLTSSNIQPNAVYDAKVCPNPNNSSCPVNFLYLGKSSATIANSYSYVVTATTTNDIPMNGAVKIEVGSSLTNVTNCIILSGFANLGITAAQQVTCTVTGNNLVISSFGYFNSGAFSVAFDADNPQAAGSTGTFTVTSYTDTTQTKRIDTGTISGSTIQNYGPPNTFTVSPTTTSGNTKLTINFGVNVANISTVTIILPSGFAVDGTPAASYFRSGELSADTATVYTYSSSSRRVVYPINASLYPNTDNSVNILELSTTTGVGFSTPTTPGTYLVQYILADSSGVTQFYIVKPWEVFSSGGSLTITPTNKDINKISAYRFQFTPSIAVPQGSISNDITAVYGKIEIEFPTKDANGFNLFGLDLGTGVSSGGSVNCIGSGGIVAKSGGLACTIYPAASASTTNNVRVEIFNFEPIAVNTSCTVELFKIYNIANASRTPTVTLNIYSIHQGITNKLYANTATVSGYHNTNPIPIYNGRSPSSYGGDGTNSISLTELGTRESTTIYMVLWPENNMTSATTKLIIALENGFTIDQSKLLCYLDYSVQLECTGYNGWVVIWSMGTAGNLANHSEYTIELTGVSNPGSINTISAVTITYIDAFVIKEYSVYADFLDIQYGQITASVSADNYEANAVDTTYTWSLNFNSDLEEGSSILLTFPEDDYVMTTSPTPECQISGALQAKSATNPITCTFDSNTVSVGNYAALTAGQLVLIKIEHVLNPSERVHTADFIVESYNSSGIIKDANYAIDGITIFRRDDIPVVKHNAFYADPDNGGFATTLYISFTPTDSVPPNSQIDIILPEGEFSGLSGNLSCRVSGGLTILLSCVGSGNIVTITNSDSYTNFSLPITLEVYNMTNFLGGLTSGLVSIQIKYSGTLFQESTQEVENRSYSTSLAPSPLTPNSINFSPRTASELSSYTFSVQLTNSLEPTCTFNVEFPSSAPRGLAYVLECESENLGKTYCWSNGRTLVVKGSLTFNPAQSQFLTVTVRYVYNPNSGLTFSGFKYYTKCGRTIIDYGSAENSTNFDTKPGYMYLTNLQVENAGVREVTNYDITTRLGSAFAQTSSDRLYVYFPQNYNLTYVGDQITCDSELLTSTATDPCLYKSNRVSITAFDANLDLTATLDYSLEVNNVENPSSGGYGNFPIVAIFDADVDQISARTYNNLNQVTPINFKGSGVDILINNNVQWTLQKGTVSKTLYALIETGAPVEFTLTTNLPEGVQITPYPIKVEIGEYVVPFKITTSQSAKLGTYVIDWMVEGLWEVSPYQKARRSTFTIVDGDKGQVEIDFYPIIPFGGQTLPIQVTLSKSPTTEFKVEIIQLTEEPNRLVINPSVLSFLPGETQKFFQMSVDTSNVGYDGQVFIFGSGEDAASFEFGQQVFEIEIGRADIQAPVLNSLSTYEIERTSAEFRCDFSEAVQIFYMIGLRGTRQPTVEEIVAGELENQESLSVAPIFGNYYNFQQPRDGIYRYDWTVTGLTAGTDYVIYVYGQDPGYLGAEITSTDFTTRAKYKTATFTLKYLDENLSVEVKQRSLEVISDILKISRDRVAFRTDYNTRSYLNIDEFTDFSESSVPTSTTSSGGRHFGGRSLQTGLGFTKLDYLIFPDPTDASSFTPLVLINSLQLRKIELQQNLELLDPNYNIVGYELLGDVPDFISEPKLKSVGVNSIEIDDLALTEAGHIYICVIGDDGDQPNTPSPYQVYQGTDSYNEPCLVTQEVEFTNVALSVTIQGLTGYTDYWVYITATNALERYRDTTSEVKIIGVSTAPQEDDDDDFSRDLAAWLGLVLGLLL